MCAVQISCSKWLSINEKYIFVVKWSLKVPSISMKLSRFFCTSFWIVFKSRQYAVVHGPSSLGIASYYSEILMQLHSGHNKFTSVILKSHAIRAWLYPPPVFTKKHWFLLTSKISGSGMYCTYFYSKCSTIIQELKTGNAEFNLSQTKQMGHLKSSCEFPQAANALMRVRQLSFLNIIRFF